MQPWVLKFLEYDNVNIKLQNATPLNSILEMPFLFMSLKANLAQKSRLPLSPFSLSSVSLPLIFPFSIVLSLSLSPHFISLQQTATTVYSFFCKRDSTKSRWRMRNRNHNEAKSRRRLRNRSRSCWPWLCPWWVEPNCDENRARFVRGEVEEKERANNWNRK